MSDFLPSKVNFIAKKCRLSRHFMNDDANLKKKANIERFKSRKMQFFGRTKFVLFFWPPIRYHNTREVATHKEPGEDEGRAQSQVREAGRL